MKIILVDNFNRDDVPDILIADNVHPEFIKELVEFLNKKHSGNDSPDYYRAVEDDYKLHKFEG